VFLYRPIYKKMFALADTANQTEIVDQKRIEKSQTINETGDSVITSQVIHYYERDNQVRLTTTKVIPKQGSGRESKTDNKKDVVLGSEGFWAMTGLVLIQVVLVTMVYGPIAAFLVELFPTRIRYTSMSLPYHIGNGIFGGLTPFIATSLFESSKTDLLPDGDPFAGLWYPIIVAGLCFIIGMIFLKNRKVADVID
jgi:hypothetical protein